MQQPFSKDVLLSELSRIYTDFKSSVISAEIIGNGVPADLVYFKNSGLFKRFVSKEVEAISWEDDKDGGGRLVMELNREGLYDMLPEALTHKEKKRYYEDYTEKFEELRQQERDARRFFSPIENEFERRVLQFDIVERELANNANEHQTREFFEFFFGDSKKLSWAQVIALVYLMPLSHKIRSDTKLISLTLSKLLNYKIEVSRFFEKSELRLNRHVSLGSLQLGIDSILSDRCEDTVFCYRISIHDVPADEYNEFKQEGKHANVIDFVQPFFFPVNARTELHLLPREGEKQLCLQEDEGKNFLGFNSYI
jgi:hypothetical protein